MTHWGDKHKPHPKGDRVIFIERETGKPIQKMIAHAVADRLNVRDIKAIRGPGGQE